MNVLEQLRAGKLAGSRRLDLSCGLREFPREIFSLADTLEVLDLSGNALSSLPEDLPRLRKLRILFCSSNRFTELPAVLGQCPQLGMVGFKANQIRSVPAAALPSALRWLILTDNQIAELPDELGQCTQLQKLMLSGNRLRSLPQTLAACSRLELLRIAANRFTALPDWLFGLPRLSWIAYAGNPLCAASEETVLSHTAIAAISWNELQLQQKLGEGASGIIYRAQWQRDDNGRDVAVKLFKGALTSDGSPHSEMAACIRAGEHPNLIGVHGKIADHPAQADALVMGLVDGSFRNLAGPPSLDSCTRDIYAAGTSFSPMAVISIALGIASAVRHLHAQGILHGDLYAHNVLHGERGEALLGDFGAASFFVPEERQRAEALQRIEVRAFACLLEELLERCAATDDSRAMLAQIADLQERCAQEDGNARPLFAEIERALQALR
ncbi:MAG: serine/threonine-protein kinase [Nitrosomonadales bacterium]|nr:serine/threonine-protein kinase [Nitrosomonadales bacterium]